MDRLEQRPHPPGGGRRCPSGRCLLNLRAGRPPGRRPPPAGPGRPGSPGGRLRSGKYLRHNDVVKIMGLGDAAAAPLRGRAFRAAQPRFRSPGQPTPAAPLRARHPGPDCPADPGERPGHRGGLGARLGLTPAAIRRHLDDLLAEGMVETRDRPAATAAGAGAGRPSCSRSPTRAAARSARLRRPGHQRAAVPGRAGRTRRGRGLRRRRRRPGGAIPPGGRRRRRPPSGAGARRGPVGRGVRGLGAAPSPPAGSCASTTARWRTSPPSSRSCARRRPR